jgi:hypothetical protein
VQDGADKVVAEIGGKKIAGRDTELVGNGVQIAADAEMTGTFVDTELAGVVGIVRAVGIFADIQLAGIVAGTKVPDLDLEN